MPQLVPVRDADGQIAAFAAPGEAPPPASFQDLLTDSLRAVGAAATSSANAVDSDPKLPANDRPSVNADRPPHPHFTLAHLAVLALLLAIGLTLLISLGGSVPSLPAPATSTQPTTLPPSEAAERGETACFNVRPQIKIGRSEALAIGLDNGNDALKGATLTPDGTLTTIRIPTAFRDAEAVRAGKQEVAYRVEGSAPFWIGETALAHDGDDLPIGPIRQRLIDQRMRFFLGAGIVELLHAASYAAGEYTLVMGFAIPNNEIVPQRDADGSERLGVNTETRSALEEHLKGASWQVARIDAEGEAATWTIHILTVMPQAQTAGTVLTCTKAPSGKTVTDLEGMTVIDIGGGDLQETEVTIDPYQLIARRPGDGTIRVARALMEKFPRVTWNAVLAQQALISGTLMTSGKTRDISAAVEAVKAGQGQALITAILPTLRQSRRFVVITGGGVLLLHDQLVARLALEQKVMGEDYLLINHGLSSRLNAIGAFFGVLFLALRKG